MIPFRGRFIYCIKVFKKPDPDGFKVWGLVEDGYLYNYLYYSSTLGIYSDCWLRYYVN